MKIRTIQKDYDSGILINTEIDTTDMSEKNLMNELLYLENLKLNLSHGLDDYIVIDNDIFYKRYSRCDFKTLISFIQSAVDDINRLLEEKEVPYKMLKNKDFSLRWLPVAACYISACFTYAVMKPYNGIFSVFFAGLLFMIPAGIITETARGLIVLEYVKYSNHDTKTLTICYSIIFILTPILVFLYVTSTGQR